MLDVEFYKGYISRFLPVARGAQPDVGDGSAGGIVSHMSMKKNTENVS